jgi:hypothetical protein
MLKAKQKLGKYRIEQRLGEGGFAAVYRAFDTVEGIRVALKIPYEHLSDRALTDFRREVRLAAQLEHPNILQLKNADFIDGHFVLVFPLGERTLADRMQSRISVAAALEYGEQMTAAVAHAHSLNIIHCDIKPENLILFEDNRLRLTDFGIAKIAAHTIRASGSGTVGYISPEQAMGRPSFRSDVFSIGLILYRMLAGYWHEWPFEWPPAGYQKSKSRIHPDLMDVMRRALEVSPEKRYRDAIQLAAALRKVKPRALRYPIAGESVEQRSTAKRDWRTVRRRQFLREFGQILQTSFQCPRCEGPVSEAMHACPWCGDERPIHRGETRFPVQCPRCRRGMKLDWAYCPWCYGPGFAPHSTREYSDARYEARCGNARCGRRLLMPFMRYCPWCHRKVRRKWKIAGGEKCPSCLWGVLHAYWSWCPWCAKSLRTT